MNNRDQCVRLVSSLSHPDGGELDRVEEILSRIEDREFFARLRSLVDAGDETDVGTWCLSIPKEDSADGLEVGDVLAGRYTIEAFIDRGGMGAVYRAADTLLGLTVALKVILPEIASDPEALRRLKQEVLLARSVSHRNVCRIYDLAWDDERAVACVTMELLDGETLTQRIEKQGPMRPEDALPILSQLAEGLDAAHGVGIIHRDFKSNNVMLVPQEGGERAVIMDFGLAISHGAGEGGESGSTFVGTPAYMSPEQVIGEELRPACDLYSFGVSIFEMLTGQFPFRRETALKTALAHVTEEPAPPSRHADAAECWDEPVLKLLSKHPDDRFATAEEASRVLATSLYLSHPGHTTLPAEGNVFVGRGTELEQLSELLEGGAEDTRDGRVPRNAESAEASGLAPGNAESAEASGLAPGNAERAEASRLAPVRLVTVFGPGGTGKSRLSQKYGWESLGQWPGGVWYCELAEARDADGILRAVASALDVPLGAGDPIVQLARAMASHGRCLIILDDFDKVTSFADSILQDWLDRAPEARFLVTSQELLRIDSERVLELEPLDPTTDGVELLEVRAQSAQPSFRIDPSNRELAESVVTNLDGLPLAIELAAPRLRVLNLEQLRDRLADRFKILSGGRSKRHETLEVTLDWSWDLLDRAERMAATQASVFEGGFTLEAAEEVFDLSQLDDPPFTLDVIQALVEKSWIRSRTVAGVPRFSMYSTVQAYAGRRMTTPEYADPEAARRHARYFASMGTRESLAALERDGGTALRNALRREVDNLVAACRRSLEAGDTRTAVDSYAAAWEIIRSVGPVRTGVELGDSVAELSDLSVADQARIAWIRGNAAKVAGEFDNAQAHFVDALRHAREVDDPSITGVALTMLAIIHSMRGRLEEAERCRSEAVEIADAVEDVGIRGMIYGTVGLGRVHPEVAEKYFREALSIHRQLGNRLYEASDLTNLGVVHQHQGQLEEAKEVYGQALAAHRETGNRRSESTVLSNLGGLCGQLGDLEQSEKHFRQALTLSKEIGDPSTSAHILDNLGVLFKMRGQLDTARSHLQEALSIHEELGDLGERGYVLNSLGAVEQEMGRPEEARRVLEDALETNRRAGNEMEIAASLCHLGSLEHSLENKEEAESSLEQAEEIVDSLGLGDDSYLSTMISGLRKSLRGRVEDRSQEKDGEPGDPASPA